MRKAALFIILALLLCACGNTALSASAPESSAETAAASAPESWGDSASKPQTGGALVVPQAPVASEAPAPETSAEEPETSALEEETPEEPEALSLEELLPSGPRVIADGVELPSQFWNGTTMIRAEDLSGRYSWFQWLAGTDEARFTQRNGEDLPVSCTVLNQPGDLESYTGEGGICVPGKETEFYFPAREFAAQFQLDLLWDAEENTVYLTERVAVEDVPWEYPVPVLMYHAVSDNLWGIEELFVSPVDMEAQIQYLLDNGYDPIFFSDLPKVDQFDKPILLTFDDGYDDNYTELFPLLQKYQVKATIFVISDSVGGEHYMNAEQIRELSDSGLVEIQSHTVSHEDLDLMTYDQQDWEMSQSRLDLARITGKIPNVISYPEGRRDANTLELAPWYFDFGVDMNGGLWYTGVDNYTVDRIYVSRFETLDEFAAGLPW